MLRQTLYRILVFMAMAVICGCATPAPKEVKLIYPSPPEEPKLVYLDSFKGESNFKKMSFLDTLLGEDVSTRNLIKPYGVTAYGDKIYVTDTQGAIVFVFDLLGQKVTFMGIRILANLPFR